MYNETYPLYKESPMLKDKLTAATHITRKSGPWIGLVVSTLVIATDLKK